MTKTFVEWRLIAEGIRIKAHPTLHLVAVLRNGNGDSDSREHLIPPIQPFSEETGHHAEITSNSDGMGFNTSNIRVNEPV